MPRIRVLLLSVALVAVLAAASLNTGRPAVTPASASDARAATLSASPLPGVGTTVQTCAGGRSGRHRDSPGGCSHWYGSGPINVVFLSRTAESPYADAVEETKPRWAPAQGGWLEARAPTHGCGSGWKTSDEQIELRLNRVSRWHLKLIRSGCRFEGNWVIVGEAHTDLYERRRCGGDRLVDLDLARDALVSSFVGGGVVNRVEYRLWRPAGTAYPDGCGGRVGTDGRVAFLWLRG